MPVIDLGSVVGPQGPQGVAGQNGQQGVQGNPGPNQVTGSTSTTLNGILQGNGSYVQAVASDNVPTAGSNNVMRSGAIYNALSQKVNPNQLDNWLFAGGGSQLGGNHLPINQNGQTSYVMSSINYVINRWRAEHATLTLQSDGILFAAETNASGYFAQIINYEQLKGKIVTYSVLYKYNGEIGLASKTSQNPIPSAPGSSGTTVLNMNELIPNGTGCGVYVYADNSLRVQMGQTQGNSITFIAAKLEIGNTQSLVHQENGVWVLSDIPNYEDQWLRCVTSLVANSDGQANYVIVRGKVSAATNKPYFNIVMPNGNVYQMVVDSSNYLKFEMYNGSTWTTIARYAPAP